MKYDVIVIGGGPAGMFSAIIAARNNMHVLLLERNERLGRKLLITGKGRCTVTNDCTAREVLENTPRNGRFLYSAMENFPPQSIKDFLQSEGCALKTERGNRVFPVSDKSQSVLDCLKRALRAGGVTVVTDRAMKLLVKEGRIAGVQSKTDRYEADCVVLATGGGR